MSTPYNVRYTLPNPILAGGNPQFWMISVGFLAVVSISDSAAFSSKAGTTDLNAAFNKWVPIVAMAAQDQISEAASMTSDPEALIAQNDALAAKVQQKAAQMSASWGLNIQSLTFEKFGRPADEANRLRMMGFA